MPAFIAPDDFEDHKQYVALLKKALLQVKPETQKKFLYFKQYEFGTKKFPLVVVDFDPKFPAALAKAGLKPTDEGLVSLTAQDQLNFEPKKGNLKRVRLKKYFATMGGGIKEVFVPPGETDDAEGAEAEALAGGPADLQAQYAQLKAELYGHAKEAVANKPAIKDKVITLLGQSDRQAKDGNLAAAVTLLGELRTLLQGATEFRTAPAGGGTQNAAAALAAWQEARKKAVEQLGALGKAISASKHPRTTDALIELQAIAKNLTPKPDSLRGVKELERYLQTDRIIDDAESPNPFGMTVALRAPLLTALEELKPGLAP
jgi:hypothetical protein